MHKLKENAIKELKAIEEKGISTSNLENAYKLVEIIKGIDKIDMMEGTNGYSNAGYDMDRHMMRDGYGRGNSRDAYANDREDYDSGNSYRRGRNQRTGRYMSRSYSRLGEDEDEMEEYRERKREYSNSRDPASKERMLDALEDFMSGTTLMLKQMFRDSDCVEEREIIQKYAKEIANM